MKTTIQHQFYGRITFDTRTQKVTVQRPDLRERLAFLVDPRNSVLLGGGYHPDRFLAACNSLGILEGAQKVETEGQIAPEEGAVE